MKALLVASLVLAPLAASASLGHEPASRRSAGTFELELTAVGLGPAGAFDASAQSCVALRSEGAASVLWGRAELALVDDLGDPRLALDAVAPRVGRASVVGAAPLAMELRAFDLAHRDEVALVGVELAEGAVAAAVGKRVALKLAVEHVGAPISMAVGECEG